MIIVMVKKVLKKIKFPGKLHFITVFGIFLKNWDGIDLKKLLKENLNLAL